MKITDFWGGLTQRNLVELLRRFGGTTLDIISLHASMTRPTEIGAYVPLKR
jgi:hypothetical protein